MNKKKFIIPAFISIVFLIYSVSYGQSRQEVCINKVCIEAEIADTAEKHQLGLMFRQSLGENKGMLFIFEKEGEYSFWMKNMNFPLDLIWIGQDNKIAGIKDNALPCNELCDDLFIDNPAKYVLEVNAGFIAKNLIKKADQVKFLPRLEK